MIKNKLINHLSLKGRKITGEKVFVEIVKKIQKESTKSFQKILQIAIINSTPIFIVHTTSNKKKKKKMKELPYFMLNNNSRISLALKTIISNTLNKAIKKSNQLKKEILQSSSSNSKSISSKKELQKKAIFNKKYFKYYKW